MNEKKPGNPWTKSLLIWVAVLFGLVLFVQMIDGGSSAATGEAIPYSEFVRQVDEGNVQSGHHRRDRERQPGRSAASWPTARASARPRRPTPTSPTG